MSLLLLIRTGQRFRSPVSPFIIISSHSFAKVNPTPSFPLQRRLTKMQSGRRNGENIRFNFAGSENYLLSEKIYLLKTKNSYHFFCSRTTVNKLLKCGANIPDKLTI